MAVTRKVRKRRKTTSPPRKESTADSLFDLNEPSDDFFRYPICIYGEKGVGKTSLASQFPDAFIFMFERGRVNLRVRQIPRRHKDGTVDPPLAYKPMDKPCTSFIPILKKVCDSDEVKTVVIDTIDRLYDSIFDWVCWNSGVSHPNRHSDSYELWNDIKFRLEQLLVSIIDSGKQLVVISHAREKEVISRLGGAYTVVCPTCVPTAWKCIQTFCDFVFYFGYLGPKRAIRVRGNDEFTCSNQLDGHFLSPDDGEPITVVPAGNSAKEAFGNLIKAFNNEVPCLQKSLLEEGV